MFINEISSDLSMKEPTQKSGSSPIKSLPSLPTKFKFLSNSLPNSPRIGGSAKTRNQSSPAPDNARSPLCDIRLQRSKSGGEHRSSVPYRGFDPWVSVNSNSSSSSTKHGDHAVNKSNDLDFKCGALCLFLPGFGKGIKPVRARRVEPEGARSTVVISHRISLENFECGSWTSSAIQCDDHENSSTLYFDLPLELIQTSVSDHQPMNSAFVLNKGCVKGVLKTTRGGSVERKSQEGRRHVRFSTSTDPSTQPSSPSSCITPRLRKAREDFNAFLEAQSA